MLYRVPGPLIGPDSVQIRGSTSLPPAYQSPMIDDNWICWLDASPENVTDTLSPVVHSDQCVLELGSVAQVIERGRTHLSRVRFPSNVIKDAEDIYFQRPGEICRVLAAINECGEERSLGSLGMRVEAWPKELGVRYVPRESETTMGMYSDMRKFFDDRAGKTVLMESHINLNGNSFRIHLDWDAGNSKGLIGYMGPHLPTASG